MRRKILALTILAIALSLSVAAQPTGGKESTENLPSIGEDVLGYEFILKGMPVMNMSEEKQDKIERAVERKLQEDGSSPGKRTRFRAETDDSYNVSLEMKEAEEIARENLTDYSWNLEDEFLNEERGRYRFLFEIDSSRYEGYSEVGVDASSGKIIQKDSRFIDKEASEERREQRFEDKFQEELSKRTNGSIMFGGFIGFNREGNDLEVESYRDGEARVFHLNITSTGEGSSGTVREKIKTSAPAEYGNQEVRIVVVDDGEEDFTISREIRVPRSFKKADSEATKAEIEKMPSLSIFGMMHRIKELQSRVGKLRDSNSQKEQRQKELRQQLQNREEGQTKEERPEQDTSSSDTKENTEREESSQQETRERYQEEQQQERQDGSDAESQPQQQDSPEGTDSGSNPGIIGNIGSILGGLLG